MLRVRCQAQATLDAKGRVALPAPIRRALADGGHLSLVITFTKGSLWAWIPEDFEARVERPLMERDPFDQDVVDFTHAVLGPAQDCEIDNAGRIRIPPMLRELAGLTKEVVIGTMGGRLEIWDKDKWDVHFREVLAGNQSRRAGMPGRSE